MNEYSSILLQVLSSFQDVHHKADKVRHSRQIPGGPTNELVLHNLVRYPSLVCECVGECACDGGT